MFLAQVPMICVAIAITFIAAITDWKTGRIPNALSAISVLTGFVYNTIVFGVEGFIGSLVAMLITAIVPLFLFKLNAMGGGDVKLFGAIGALLGTQMGLEIETLSFIFGAIFGIAVWAKQGNLKNGTLAIVSFIFPFKKSKLAKNAGVAIAKQTTIKFAPCIFAGTIGAFLLSKVNF